ncbi:MAG: helix-turn-helix domain-containing protein [Bradymonadales bacterium]|nr:helix-turn-helix domain-containing protein [Bradymonadales bacterium]
MDGVETPGFFLRAAREREGLSIKELAAVTRIAPRFINCLEEDRYDEIPGEVFVRGFLRNCARELAIDPDELIHLYEQFTGQVNHKTGQYGGNSTDPRSMDTLLTPTRVPKLSIILAIIAIILGLGLSILIFGRPDVEELSTGTPETTVDSWHQETP